MTFALPLLPVFLFLSLENDLHSQACAQFQCCSFGSYVPGMMCFLFSINRNSSLPLPDQYPPIIYFNVTSIHITNSRSSYRILILACLTRRRKEWPEIKYCPRMISVSFAEAGDCNGHIMTGHSWNISLGQMLLTRTSHRETYFKTRTLCNG